MQKQPQNKQNYLLCLQEKYKIQLRIKQRFTVCPLHVLIRTFLKCLHLLISSDVIQYVVIINVINYPELFCQTQFTNCRISITMNFINNFPLIIVLNTIAFQIPNIFC